MTIYFATPYPHGNVARNENTNVLIRQYLPKRTTMKRLTQARCHAIAHALNNRPRKRHGFRLLDRLANHFVPRAVKALRASFAPLRPFG